MTAFRLFEICIYELVDLFPNLILALLPFRDSMRFSPWKNALFSLLLYVLITVSRILALNRLPAAAILSVIWIVLYLAFYMAAIKTQITKLLFVLLTLLNYCSFVVVVFSHLAYHRFPQAISRPYSLYSTGVLALVYLISYPFVYLTIHNKMRALIIFPGNNRYWNYLWLVPATFCLTYYYNLFTNGGIISFSASLSHTTFAVFLNLGALFVTYLVMHLLEESNANLELKAENYQLHMQSIQYENLQGRIEDARRAKHDLRQNLAVIQSFLQYDDREGLLNYLHSYLNSLPSDSPMVYCSNDAVNALLVYYADMASESGISIDIDAEYPTETAVADSDAVILVGNLLENAVEACRRQPSGNPFISLHMKHRNRMLVITLDNSYSGKIRQEGNLFYSSKTDRPGTGTLSIRKITGKYNGILQFHYQDGQFHASVMLQT